MQTSLLGRAVRHNDFPDDVWIVAAVFLDSDDDMLLCVRHIESGEFMTDEVINFTYNNE